MRKTRHFVATGLGTLALAATAASPAMARDRHDDGGIGAGEIIAGALVIGGLIAILSDNDDDDRYDDRYRDGRYYDQRASYGYRGGGRAAVERCVAATESEAGRRYRGYANVTEVRDIDRYRDGYRISGLVEVDNGRHGRRGGRYGRGGYDVERFSCNIRRGRVVDVDIS